MKIAVTGGAGFIGRACVARIHELGWTAISIDRHPDGNDGDDRYVADVRDPIALKSALAGCDTVVHLAGVLGTSELFTEPDLAISVNVIGTLRVLEACRDAGAGFVGISMPPVFPSLYTATKVCATRFATAFHHAYDLPVSHVTAFNAFGVGQAHGYGHPRKIIPAFSVEAWRREPITVWGDGEQTVDLIHTDDLARMLVDATKFGNDENFDGGTGDALTVNEVAVWVNKIAGSYAGINHMPMRPGEIATNIVASGAGWDELGWQPRLQYGLMNQAVHSYRTLALKGAA